MVRLAAESMTGKAAQVAKEVALAYPGSDVALIEARLASIVAEVEESIDADAVDGQLESWRVDLYWRRARWADPYAALADLERRIRRAAPRPEEVLPKLKTFAGNAIEHWVVVASLVTLVVSGFYGLAYARFYGILDTTPEEVGFSTARIISNSVAGGLTLAALGSVGFFLLMAPLVPRLEDECRCERRASWRDVGLNAAVALAAAVALFWVLLSVDAPLPGAAFVAGMYLCGIVPPTSFRIDRARRRVKLRRLDFKLDNYVAVLVSGVAVGVLMTALVTYVEAENLGNEARDGIAVRNPDIVGVPFLGVRAEPARIVWKERASEALPIPGCVFFLGSSSAYTLLYDHRTERTLQVPNGNLALSLRQERTTCEAPVNLKPPRVRRLADGRYQCFPGRWDGDPRRSFDFRWSAEGDTIRKVFGGDSQVMLPPALHLGKVVRCHVTATTPLGADVAISQGVVLAPIPRRRPSGGVAKPRSRRPPPLDPSGP